MQLLYITSLVLKLLYFGQKARMAVFYLAILFCSSRFSCWAKRLKYFMPASQLASLLVRESMRL